MRLDTSASTTPRFSEFATNSVQDARKHMSLAIGEHGLEVPRRASLAFKSRSLETSRLQVNELQYGQSVVINAPKLQDLVLFQLTLSGRCYVETDAHHFESAAGTAFVVDPHGVFRKRWSPDCRQLIVKIGKVDLQKALCDTLGLDDIIPIEFLAGALDVRGSPAGVAKLLEAIIYMAGAAQEKDFPPIVVEGLEQQFLLSFMGVFSPTSAAALAHGPGIAAPSFAREPGRSQRHEVIAPASVVRARRFMVEHYGEQINLLDIASATGSGPRALQRAFAEAHSCSPMSWLRDLRLRRAREQLELGEEGSSVTDVALDCGFGHLGRFAKAYQTQFCERPSETLRRAVALNA